MDLTGKTAIVKFWAPWCQPCKVIAEAVTDAASSAGVELINVNVDEDFETAEAFAVKNIPMVVGVKSGNFIDQLVGARSKAEYEALAQKLK